MGDLIEIAAAMLAAVGIARLLELLAEAILYPRRVRRAVRLYFDGEADVTPCEAREYAEHLYKSGKISSKRLIIPAECGIIKENPPPEEGEIREINGK